MSNALRKTLTDAGLDPRLHGGVDGAVLLLVGRVAEALEIHRQNTHFPYYCVTCRGPFPCRTRQALS